MKRLFVEKKPAFRSEAEGLLRDLRDSLRLTGLQGLRILQRYDVEGASEEAIRQAIPTVFAEPPVDDVHLEYFPLTADEVAVAVGEDVLIITRTYPGETMRIVLNRGDKPVTVRINDLGPDARVVAGEGTLSTVKAEIPARNFAYIKSNK